VKISEVACDVQKKLSDLFGFGFGFGLLENRLA